MIHCKNEEILNDTGFCEQLEQMKTVYCDCCLEKGAVAVKTCLKCEVSLCQEHLQAHLTLPAFLDHALVEPLADLQQRKCSQHEDQVLSYYCRVSRRYICTVCDMESKQRSHITEAFLNMRRHLIVSADPRSSILGRKKTNLCVMTYVRKHQGFLTSRPLLVKKGEFLSHTETGFTGPRQSETTPLIICCIGSLNS